ncbi:MAG TPA: phosphotransferase [Propionibacteriaceae bacterium]|nr:phosphotransferase [Propionibacteriaceae bacterium]
MNPEDVTSFLPTVIASHWPLTGVRVEDARAQDMTILADVSSDQGSWVATLVPTDGGDALFAGTLATAEVGGSGVRVGAALTTTDGRTVVDVADGTLALLAPVPGRPLTASPEDQALAGEILARAHRAGIAGPDTESTFFTWLTPADPGLQAEMWIARAVADATIKYKDAEPSLTFGWLHCDPSPADFRIDEDGTPGLTDWTGAEIGPLLYDVATFVSHLGRREDAEPFLDAYVAAGGVSREELETHLDALLVYRWAVRSAFWSFHILTADPTGNERSAEDVEGLEHARQELLALGVE